MCRGVGGQDIGIPKRAPENTAESVSEGYGWKCCCQWCSPALLMLPIEEAGQCLELGRLATPAAYLFLGPCPGDNVSSRCVVYRVLETTSVASQLDQSKLPAPIGHIPPSWLHPPLQTWKGFPSLQDNKWLSVPSTGIRITVGHLNSQGYCSHISHGYQDMQICKSMNWSSFVYLVYAI